MKSTPIKVPKGKLVLLISGIPGCGKTTFCRYLHDRFGFAHYDMEKPEEWPHPELHDVWDSSRKEFVQRLRTHHQRLVLDYGFPPSCVSYIRELQAEEVNIIWFRADINAAKVIFFKRDTVSISCFDVQVKNIMDAELPLGLGAIEVDALTRSGKLRKPEAIARAIFAAILKASVANADGRGTYSRE